MTLYLFDSSAIINLVKRGMARPFAEGATLDLALYESLNAIWKEHQLLKRFDKDTALLFIDIINNIFNIIDVLSIRGFESDVFNLASKESLTVCDASYLYTAMKNNLILVTDDDKLRNKASRYIRILTSAELSLRYRV